MSEPPLECSIARAGAGGTEVHVVLAEGMQADREWMRSVASDLNGKTIFKGPVQDERPSNYTYERGAEGTCSETDDKVVAEAKPTGEMVLTPNGLDKRIAADREEGFDMLAQQLRSSMGVIPFVGAGMSKGFGFADWGELLKKCAAGTPKEKELVARIDAQEYEEAAEEIAELSRDRFQRRIAHAFSRNVDESALRASALPLLARLTEGPVITTNFDRVLEQAFRLAGRPFEEVVAGPQPDSMVRAIHQNRRVLLKIHGDCLERTQRTFTREEYDQNWGKRGAGASLGRLAWLMFANRPLLFLGYSLQSDRTVEALEKIHQMLPGLAHFAIVAAHYIPSKLDQRRRELDSLGVIPIWFPPGHFDSIKETLSGLLTAVSVRRIADTAVARKLPGQPFRLILKRFLTGAPATREALLEEPPPVTGEQLRKIERIARAVLRGRVTFFLGSGAHLGNMPEGNEFYERIAAKFGCSHLQLDRSAVARYVVDRYGREALVDESRGLLSTQNVPMSVVFHLMTWLVATIGRPTASRVALTIFTTNQDRMMERAFSTAGAKYHEFKYIGAGPMEGKFAWRRPDGRIDLVERPDNVDSLDWPAPVLVKINGGFSADPMMPESVLLARGDFEKLAGRIPDALPAVLRSAVRDNSMLFLGHGLNEPDVEALIRYSSPSGVLKSWAVHRPDTMADRVDYWENCGLELIPCDLGVFVRHLFRATNALVEPTEAAISG